MRSLVMFLPNMLVLCARLMTDPRVPRADKALFAGAILYALIPLDFIPDMIPFVGQVDDVYLISLTLLRLINHTDELVVRQLWRGGGDIVKLAESVASVAPLILPQRVRRVLLSKVEVAPSDANRSLKGIADKPGALLVEIPGESES